MTLWLDDTLVSYVYVNDGCVQINAGMVGYSLLVHWMICLIYIYKVYLLQKFFTLMLHVMNVEQLYVTLCILF
jgi:hypothetical protein